ncbi:hypothetical protein M5K25_008465 [Dendrobium thyrsiflorum]|uniref:Protein kinase domain-containing protein n=1 Tax=Dendrobium thyrsiflorum TaxID=117978 RepID=A0ABD0V8S2_DENTH
MQTGGSSLVVKVDPEDEFFTEYGEASRYEIIEVIGRGSYGVVGAAVDTKTGEKVAIKKINDVFEHVSDATRILREIKLLRLLRHRNIVEIKHIMLPPSRREFKDIYVVFELMESDLHQVIRANDDLTPEHHQFFLYQLLRSLKYIHSANVFHRDLKPKNILANSDCKLKICDFGLARASFNDAPSPIFWTVLHHLFTEYSFILRLCGNKMVSCPRIMWFVFLQNLSSSPGPLRSINVDLCIMDKRGKRTYLLWSDESRKSSRKSANLVLSKYPRNPAGLASLPANSSQSLDLFSSAR